MSFVQQLPERSIVSSIPIDLPESTVGEIPGPGRLLELDESGARLDGQAVGGSTVDERAVAIGRLLAEAPTLETEASDKKPSALLYVATTRSLDVQTLRSYVGKLPDNLELRLLLRVAARTTESAGANPSPARDLSEALLLERDPAQREVIARQGYQRFSRCQALSEAVSAPRGINPQSRWPELRQRLLTAIPECDCATLDTESLRPLLAAEQRAGTLALGWVPLSFVRDQRCGASMPLRSLQKLVTQIEHFDEEFSGRWGKDALEFGSVLQNDRLLGFFCNALPGETLAALERAGATLYLRVPGSESCEALRFEPLSPGAPMGSWKRAPRGSEPTLTLHYWQAAEEIRVYGPADPSSKPTDSRDWPCQQNFRLTDVDAEGINLEHGRWFFSEAACTTANPEPASVPGCLSSLIAPGARAQTP